ncbi:MAG: DUF5654 family protein [archaeon]
MPKEELTRNQKVKIKAKESARKFKIEMKKAIGTAMVAAFGFLIALVWKDVITEWVETITAISPIQGKLIQALLVTLIAVIGIIIVTRLFSKNN